MKFKKKQKGLTLIEVIIALAIFAIIVVPILTMSVNTVRNTTEGDNKLKALAIAQRNMEEIKSSGNINTTFYSREEDGLNVEATFTEMEDYKYSTTVTQINEPPYDAVIKVSNVDGITRDIIDTTKIFSIPSPDQSNSLVNIEGYDDRDINVEVRFSGTKDLRFDIINHNNVGFINIYFKKPSENISTFKVTRSEGKVRFYSNIFTDAEDNNSLYRLYKVTVTVRNKGNGKVLQVLEGYKSFLK